MSSKRLSYIKSVIQFTIIKAKFAIVVPCLCL
jgi:hypothetical protein